MDSVPELQHPARGSEEDGGPAAQRTSRRTERGADREKIVCMLSPGGLEHAGGIGRWAGYLLQEWNAADHTPPLRIVDTRGFGGLVVGAVTFVRAVGELGWLYATGRLGLIHANLSIRGSTLRKGIISRLAQLAGIPVIVHLHAGRYVEFYEGLPPWMKAEARGIFSRAAQVIVLGKIWEDALARLGVPRSKMMILFNAVPAPDLSLRAPVGDGQCHIVMLGRLGPAKGLPELLEALATPEVKALNWRATVAGDGDARFYQRQAGSLGLSDRIAFPGWLDAGAVSRLLLTADVLVLPSRAENLPVAVIEGMSYGLAIVTTPVGATPEIVQDEVSALLVPVQDAQALAGALRRLLEQPDLRRAIGGAARQAFEEKLDIERSARELSALYTSILSEARSGHS